MPLAFLDHVNIRTGRLEVMRAFYRDVLGLRPGPRPPFSFGGAWLYCGDRPVVHLVEVEVEGAGDVSVLAPARSAGPLRLSHFAFAATGLRDFVAGLRAAGVPHQLGALPGGSGVRQVSLTDPDGNDLHVDFAPDDRIDGEGGAPP